MSPTATGDDQGPVWGESAGQTVTIQSLSSPINTGNHVSFNATLLMPLGTSVSANSMGITTSGTLRSTGTFGWRYASTYTWVGVSDSWTNGNAWNYHNNAPGDGYDDSVLLTNGGTINLGGSTQSVVQVGTISSPVVGNIQNGTVNFTGDIMLKSGTVSTDLTNNGGVGRLWVGGGDSNAVETLGGNNSISYIDHQATIIGHSICGAAGTVKLTNANALNAPDQDTQVWSGTLDLNGVADVRSRTISLAAGSASKLFNNNTSMGAVASTSATILTTTGCQIGGDGMLTLNGLVSGDGFTATGSGGLTLTANNNYGTTTVYGGIVQVGDGTSNATTGSLGTGTVTLSNNGGVSFARSNDIVVSNNISAGGMVGGDERIYQNGAGKLTLTGTNYYGRTIINSGALQIGNGGTTGTLSPGTVTNSATLIFNRSDNIAVSTTINGYFVRQ
jgi:autotransporter-associated beta strand protein